MSVLYLHFETPSASRVAKLEKSGAHVVVAEPRWPGFFELAKKEKPYAIAIDFSQAPSHALETADYLSKAKETRGRAALPPARSARPARGRREAPPPGHRSRRTRAVGQARRDREARPRSGRAQKKEAAAAAKKVARAAKAAAKAAAAGKPLLRRERKAGPPSRAKPKAGPPRRRRRRPKKPACRQETSARRKRSNEETRMAGFTARRSSVCPRQADGVRRRSSSGSSRSRPCRSSPTARARSGGRAEYAVSLLESFGAKADAPRDDGSSDRLRPLRPRPAATRPSRSTTTWTSSPPRAPSGRPSPSSSSARATRYFGRGTTDDKGPGAHRALRRAVRASSRACPLNIHFLWELEEEIGSPHFEATIRANAKDVRDRLRRRLRHGLGLARAAGLPGGPARPAGLPLRLCRPARPISTRARPAAPRATRSPSSASSSPSAGRQDRPRQDPGLLHGRRPADEEGARGPQEVRLHGQGLQEGPPLPVAARRGPARGDEADLDDADVRGPRHRRRLPGPGREDDHSAQGHGDRLLPPRARHEPEEDRQAGHGLREEQEPGREGLRRARAAGLPGQDHRPATPTRSAAR